jgi:transcription elongation factor GreA
MTPHGYQAIQAELKRLKSLRPELALAIEIARGHGDLSENGDYDAAKEKSGMTEAKIRDFETKLANAEIIDPQRIPDLGKVVFGLSVVISDVDSGEERTLTLVGSDESDVASGHISFESPLGRGLIGRSVGDIAKIQLPGGAREFEILDIRKPAPPDSSADGSSSSAAGSTTGQSN